MTPKSKMIFIMALTLCAAPALVSAQSEVFPPPNQKERDIQNYLNRQEVQPPSTMRGASGSGLGAVETYEFGQEAYAETLGATDTVETGDPSLTASFSMEREDAFVTFTCTNQDAWIDIASELKDLSLMSKENTIRLEQPSDFAPVDPALDGMEMNDGEIQTSQIILNKVTGGYRVTCLFENFSVIRFTNIITDKAWKAKNAELSQ